MAGFLSPLTSGTPEAPGGSRARQRRARSCQEQGEAAAEEAAPRPWPRLGQGELLSLASGPGARLAGLALAMQG